MTDMSIIPEISEENTMEKIKFPKDFVFGTATAAYQIEGAHNEDGKGKSIWDKFTHTPGKISDKKNADIACDHYHRYKDDISLMRDLNLDAYRFSISWPRIMPRGKGQINQKGLDFYSRLVDKCLEAGIDPYVTLFHWDLPLALQDEYKGFANREVSKLYADYTEVVVKHLGDRVKNWITINEPWEFSAFGHFLGAHAPGRKSLWAYFKVMHNILLAHGMGMERIKSICPDSNVGITLSITPIHPQTDSEKDKWAAEMGNQFMNHITLAPLFKGEYPEMLWKKMKLFRPKVHDGDMEIISKPLDFVGINTYSRDFAAYKWYVPFLNVWINSEPMPEAEYERDGVQYTSMGWQVYPESIYEALKMVKEYGNTPAYITENGVAYNDVVENGRVNDPKRIDYFKGYLKMIHKAMEEGSDVRGYFAWSFMDNFEWAEGFKKRFGLVHVDHSTLERTVKDSGYWFRDFIKEQKN